jgi:uncharacterized protein (DUF1684 family)
VTLADDDLAGPSARDRLDLLDWKRRIFDLYREVRLQATDDPVAAWSHWRDVRDGMFATHPQSPIPPAGRGAFAATGLPFFDHDPAARVLADLQDAPRQRYDIGTSGDGTYSFTRFATASFEFGNERLSLEAYWLDGYGGGIFLPFRDATAGDETYGAGRYLLDTVKGADLGVAPDGRLVLDFNFAYNPSCSYDPKWVCPLAPPPNRLTVPVRAGERHAEPGAGPGTEP